MVTRIQFGTADNLAASSAYHEGNLGQPPAAPAPSTRVGGGAIRYTAGDSEATQGGTTRHIMSFGGTAGGSVAQTLQNVNGKQTAELIPGDPSTRTLVRTAVRDGLIQRNNFGAWEDLATQKAAVEALAAPKEEQVPQHQDNPEDVAAGVFSAEDDADWAADIAPLDQGAYDAATASVVGYLVNGGDLEATARAFAERAGMEPELAMDYLNAGYGYHASMVQRALAPMGIAGDRMDAFVDFMGTQPGKYQDAIQRLVHTRDLGGFKALAVEWSRHNTNPADAAFRAAGMQTAHDPVTGGTLYRMGTGPWVTMKELVASNG